MRAKFLLVPAIVLGTGLLFSGSNAAADDVYVDLSVLDGLGETVSPAINNGPLFPVVKKAEPRKAVKKSAPARKAKPAAKKKTAEKSLPAVVSDKLEIPAKPEIKVEVKMPEQAETPVKTTVSETEIPVDLQNSPFAKAPVENREEEISAAPTAPVEIKTEPLSDVEKEPVIMEPINGTTPLPSAQEDNAVVTAVPESLFRSSDETKQNEISSADEQSVAAPLIEKNVLPLIPLTTPEKAEIPSGEVVFLPDSYDLTDEDKARLDAIVASFENPSVNKIAIYAYNVDDGKDVFRKKRLSLNRAVEVRSYLLGKGYKNFSIKVVNISEPEDKENKVVVEELK